MLRLGVDRAWIAKECDYKSGSLAQILAPNGNQKYKTDKALRRIWEALDREEECQRANIGIIKPLGHRVFMEPSEKQFDRWMQAVYAKPGRNFDDWAKQGLDAMADRDLGALATAGPALAPLPDALSTPEPILPLSHIPFFGLVAAGTPAGALDDMLDESAAVPGTWPANAFALRVSGRSMEPDYPDGSTIVCRPLKPGEYPTKGQDVISSDADGVYFKRLAYTKDGPKGDTPRKAIPHLVSINPEFPEVVPAADCPIVAIVVG